MKKLEADYLTKHDLWDTIWLEEKHPGRFNVGYTWMYDTNGKKVEAEVIHIEERTIVRKKKWRKKK